MKVETKFNVNDFAKGKYDTTSKDVIQLLEIMEVLSQTCYAGTQVFYLCRPIIAQKKYEHSYKQEGDFNWIIGHGVNNSDNLNLGWKKYREDELIQAEQKEIVLITK